MKKSIWIFLLAVLLPGAVLGWLALRSAEEQQIILERRTAELYQKETDAVAEAARAVVDEQRRAFADAVRKLLAAASPEQLALEFSTRLAAAWPRKAVGFALGADGKLLSPTVQSARDQPAWRDFLLNNGGFLAGTTTAQVYWVQADELNRPDVLRKAKTAYDNKLAAEQAAPQPMPTLDLAKEEASRDQSLVRQRAAKSAPAQPQSSIAPMPMAPAAAPAESPEKTAFAQSKPQPKTKEIDAVKDVRAEPFAEMKAPEQQPPASATRLDEFRNVAPQRVPEDNKGPALSQLTLATAGFPALASDSTEGVVTRFVQDRLDILFWMRPPQAPQMVFGCLIEADSFRDSWPAVLPPPSGSRTRSSAPEFVLALLDDKARPVATRPPGETGRDWKRPFVASEIGEALPHWEAALDLLRPRQLEESARGVRRTMTFLIVAALGAIACGGWLVVADARRQMALAQQKTDFVSNVSHELKTPLTSIRMFAELMQNGAHALKHAQYSRIIMVEAERLTRLINNVLDFARLERRQKSYDKHPFDLSGLIARTWENHELHLRESGFTTRWDAAPAPYPVIGDEDAIAQILVNLLSNAEKYSDARKEVELRSCIEGPNVCVSVLDRGLGVPAGEERKIFGAFYRAHDSLASGIQGSGLGLTLAQRLAAEHGGDIVYSPRDGGGSVFTLRLPLNLSEAR